MVLPMFGLSFLSGFLSVELLGPDQELRGLHACMHACDSVFSPWNAFSPLALVLLGSLMSLLLALTAAT